MVFFENAVLAAVKEGLDTVTEGNGITVGGV